jgi:CheY-like chemotaxis protein
LLNILIVEDEVLLAYDLADLLEDLGHRIVGPGMSAAAALGLIADHTVDFAVLDFNLREETSAPVADALAERGIPFFFLTGYRRDALPERFSDRVVLAKPVRTSELSSALRVIAPQ